MDKPTDISYLKIFGNDGKRLFHTRRYTCRTNEYVSIVAVSLVKQWSIDRSQSNSRAIKCIIERYGTNINGTSSSPRSAEAVESEARERAKLGERRRARRRQCFLRRGLFFPRRSNFLAVVAAATRNSRTNFSYWKRVREPRSSFFAMVVRSSRLLFCTVISQGKRERERDARYIYVYNCTHSTQFLPLKK